MSNSAHKLPYHNILVNRIAITLALSISVLIALRLSAGALHPIAIFTGITVVLVFFLVAMLSGKKISATAGAWTLVFMFWLALTIGGYAAGGLKAPVIVVFSLIPLASAYLIDVRATLIMCILSITSVVVFFLIEVTGLSQPVPIENSKIELLRMAWLIFVIFLVSIMGWFYSKKMELLNNILEEQASTDFLTKLANRRRLDEMLEQEFYRTRRYKNWLTILMVDIDHFKKFNDEEGHVKGDESLILVARCIKDFCQRSTDIVGRYGGEEFLLILPDLKPYNAQILAENIRKAVQDISIECNNPDNQNLSVTIGCLSVCGTNLDNPLELISSCDKLLYEGKNAGRNNVRFKSEIVDQASIKK